MSLRGLINGIAVALMLTAFSSSLHSRSLYPIPKRPNYPKIILYHSDKGPTKDLSDLDNTSCPDIPCIDAAVRLYMQKYSLTGASLAIMRRDSLLYVKGYGWADKEKGIAMEPFHRMRVASVSKLLTAVGIMKLREEGRLSLDDKVFAPEGILGGEWYCSDPADTRVREITVEHLLRHSSGIPSKKVDYMFRRDGGISGEEVVRKNLAVKLSFEPGTDYEYSNTGYYVLCLIIEKITGRPYEEWMQENVFAPACCSVFAIAGSYEKDRLDGEVRYYMHPGSKPVPDSVTGRRTDVCYGGNNVRRLKGAGAWMATAPELCRIVAAIDEYMGIWDILRPESVETMTQYICPPAYALGWLDVTPDGVWTRTGSYAGTTAIVKYFSEDGDCWVLLTNTSTAFGPKIALRSTLLVEKLRETSMTLLPHKDLFYQR